MFVVVAGFLTYLLASFALFDRTGILTGTHYVGNGADPYLYMWSFYFILHAIVHGQNPFIISAAWAPAGLNITQATTTPGVALLAWPLTAIFGPIISFNIVALMSPALCATTALLLAYALSGRFVASFIGGWIFGFSTFEFGAMLGHLQTYFVPMLPLAFLVVALRGRSRLGAPAFVALLSAINVLQFMISLETFVTTAIFLSLFFMIQTGMKARSAPWRSTLCECALFALSFFITIIVVSPYIYYFFIDYDQIPHILMNGGKFSIDLLNFFIPTVITWIGHSVGAPIAEHFLTNASEEVGYIGLPLVIVTAFAIVQTRRVPLAFAAAIIIVVACVFAMGPNLAVGGRPEIELPWILMEHLPLLANVITGRMMVYAMLGIGLVCALWLSQIKRGYYLASAGVFIAALLMLPDSRSNTMTGWYNKIAVPQLIQNDIYRQYIARHSIVMVLPVLAANGDAILWQTETKGYFRILDGYGDFVPPPFIHWPVIQMLGQGAAGPGFSKQFNLFMKYFGAQTVLAPASQLTIWGAALRRAGWHEKLIGHIGLFTMPAKSWASIPVLSRSDTIFRLTSAHLAALKGAATCMIDKGATILNPGAAIAAGCLAPDFGAGPGPANNWDKMSGWLGFLGNEIGVSVVTSGTVANRLVKQAGDGAAKIYFPYPKIYNSQTAKSISWGQLIIAYDPGSLKSAKPN